MVHYTGQVLQHRSKSGNKCRRPVRSYTQPTNSVRQLTVRQRRSSLSREANELEQEAVASDGVPVVILSRKWSVVLSITYEPLRSVLSNCACICALYFLPTRAFAHSNSNCAGDCALIGECARDLRSVSGRREICVGTS